ncbi:hypothetical protein K1719_014913 [Acacia pycnantha]|nr:hypothetical protein K1719_014913 [Acacia pycnantha]
MYTERRIWHELEKLIKEAKCLFVEEIDPSSKLELISTIQNLGLANHFQEEIKEALESLISVKNNNNIRVHDDHGHVYTNAQCFKILRQNGYDVSPGIEWLRASRVQQEFKCLRKWLTKVINFVLVIDDVYDVYASFEELKQFTLGVDRWDANELQKLPKCMRICFKHSMMSPWKLLLKFLDQTTFTKFYPTSAKAWKDFCKSLYVEAEWYKEDFIFNVSLIIRLCNDLGTTVAERERGDAASSIVCYMNQMDVTEEEARTYIEDIIKRAWKKINEHCFFFTTHQLDASSSEQEFVSQAMNAARVAHTLYQNNGDGFGIQDGDIKKLILSLLIESFLDV